MHLIAGMAFTPLLCHFERLAALPGSLNQTLFPNGLISCVLPARQPAEAKMARRPLGMPVMYLFGFPVAL